jgi:long-subunit acyl-CoA synthetase (AMP-forming)
MGHNAPEWVISFMGAIFANCVSSGVYITNLPDACLYQAHHSEAEVVVVDSIA